MNYSAFGNQEQNPKALVLIPCCKTKSLSHPSSRFSLPLNGIQQLRAELHSLVSLTPALANIPANQRGILNPNAPSSNAIDFYNGNFYRIVREYLRHVMEGRIPFLHTLIVSSFYGLVKLDEQLSEYELQMADTLLGKKKVYRFWQEKGLWKILKTYIQDNNISYIWSLLPESQNFPYHRVFEWSRLRNSTPRCFFHVEVPKAGIATNQKRAQWLAEVLQTPIFLVGKPLPPNQFKSIPYTTFLYKPC